LKLIADVGFVGLPNAGKSTLLARLTRARPKIAAYPFTTREPHLGIVELPGYRRLVLADLPGLIEGAHEGVGLGDTFLKHIERTRVILHVLDLCPPEGAPTPVEAYRMIRGELEKYSKQLAQRDEIIVGNKLDLTEASDALAELRAELDRPVLGISGVAGTGLRGLTEALWNAVEEVRRSEIAQPPERFDLDQRLDAPTEEGGDEGPPSGV
jgi:GTP-binding protein